MTKALNILFGFFIVVITILIFLVVRNNLRIKDLEDKSESGLTKSELNDKFIFQVNKNIMDYIRKLEESKVSRINLNTYKKDIENFIKNNELKESDKSILRTLFSDNQVINNNVLTNIKSRLNDNMSQDKVDEVMFIIENNSLTNDKNINEVKQNLLNKIKENTDITKRMNIKIDDNEDNIEKNKLNIEKNKYELSQTEKNLESLITINGDEMTEKYNYNAQQQKALNDLLNVVIVNYNRYDPLLTIMLKESHELLNSHLIEYEYYKIFENIESISYLNIDIQNKFNLIKNKFIKENYEVLKTYFTCLTDYIIKNEIELMNIIDNHHTSTEEFLNKSIDNYVDNPDSLVYKIMKYIREHSGVFMGEYIKFENKWRNENFFFVDFPKYLILQRYNTIYNDRFVRLIESDLFFSNPMNNYNEIKVFYDWLLRFIGYEPEKNALTKYLTYDTNLSTDRMKTFEDQLIKFNKNKKTCSDCPSKNVYSSQDYIVDDFMSL
jgi:hypothetical protein